MNDHAFGRSSAVPDAEPLAPASPYPSDRTLSDLFDEQASRSPDAIAAEGRDNSVTYLQLRQRVDQLARYLMLRGVARGSLVGICLDRSIDTVVALLAVLKAGAAYVPLDPAYPRARLEMVLEDAGVAVVLTQQSLLPQSDRLVTERIVIDSDRASIAREDDTPLRGSGQPDDVAYVIFTSGSTGRPKGVQVTNRNLVNFLWSMRREPGMQASDVVPAITTISFDIATLELFLPLVVGARVVLLGRAVATDGRRLAAALHRCGATIVQATPATWRLLLEAGWPGSPHLTALSGGEALPRELADRLLDRCGALWNMYGPTETTVWSAVHRVRRGSGPVPIGRPIANTHIHVLDDERRPVPIGTDGEIYIGGDGVALGYLNRPALTAERFLPDPFTHAIRSRLYRTGDVGRRQPDGTILFVGRADHQVKIRGYRIEPGEIETVLDGHPHIRQAVVTAADDPSGGKRLVAYYCSDDGKALSEHDVRRFLKDRVPEYMVPSTFVHLEAMPLTPNGKVDRRALPKCEGVRPDRDVVAPRDEVERALVSLWERILGAAPIGIDDDFFDLGGHSLLALRLFAEIGRRFGCDLPLASLVAAPTIAQLARLVRGEAAERWDTLVTIQGHGARRPLFIVHGGGGTVLFLRDLAHHLGTDRPVFGLQCEGLDGRPITRTTVEQMAAHYLASIRRVQPQGPYLLAGYCFGGIVVFEMAQQLRRRGERADLVALFNAPNRAVPEQEIEAGVSAATTRVQALAKHRRALARLAWSARAGYLREALRGGLAWRRSAARDALVKLAHSARGVACAAYLAAGRRVPQHLRDVFVFDATTAAERHYVPVPYPGGIVIFRGAGLYKDPQLGWGGLAYPIDTVEVGGPQRFRREIVKEPVVQQLARELNAWLDRADAATAGVAA